MFLGRETYVSATGNVKNIEKNRLFAGAVLLFYHS